MIDIVVRTSAVLIAGFALAGIFASRSAAVRHWILAATLFGAAAVVPLSFVAPEWTIAVPSYSQPFADPAAPSTRATASAVSVSVPAAAQGRTLPVGPLVWAAGFLLTLAMIAVGVVRLGRLSARARPVTEERWLAQARTVGNTYGLRRAVVLVEADAPFVPATWGSRRPHVLLPPQAREWSVERIHAVLCHELAHVARADWLIQLAVQVVVALLWFHPLAWVAAQQLRREAERACDDAVLDRGVNAAEYAMHLVALARDCRRPSWALMPALLMAHPSAFERRIAAMLNPHLDRRPLSLGVATAVGAALVTLTSAVAAAHAGQAPPGALSGTVYDPSGGVIPGVTLTLSNSSWRTVSTSGGTVTVTEPQQSAAQATTDSAGRFSFPGIAPGRYVLSATLPGFHQLHEEFDLKADPDWDRAVTLQVGTLRETISVRATRTFAAPAAAGPGPIRVGGNIRVPVKLKDVRPEYPESMRAEGREADVELEATIGRDGSVSTVRVVSAQIHPDFAIAAVDAVRQWRFTPTLLNGKPIEVVMTVKVHFGLSD